ncbi:elongation factor G [Pseudonocardia parietis]|uniref:Elongation factor G n=1 Tax=Pseudonocardia parietis TaxID=570936 RepID=A0ABS4VXT0_9PSEU|nr:GTP-binding protein [Pseudonocardia parietis]MBP2368752.1 elongation factor G [Pseudonocardia parietis]
MAVKAGRAPTGTPVHTAVTDPALVRNVALVGPSGAGKTTLAEMLLARAGAISRAGSVTEGSTVCDHDAAAVRQHRSVGLTLAPLRWRDVTVNLLDTPGYGDFRGELLAGFRAADAALFVLPASEGRDGTLEPGTVTLWEECAGIPRAVVLTRCDSARADIEATVAACRDAFGPGVVPIRLPVRDGAGDLTGLHDLLAVPDGTGPPGADDARSALIEQIIEQSEDEDLLERYLGGEDLPAAALAAGVHTALLRGSFHPVVPVSAAGAAGADELLDLLLSAFPAPAERTPPDPVEPYPAEPGPAALRADPEGPLVAEVVHTGADPYVGRICLVRVFSGTLRPDSAVHVGGPVPTARDGAGVEDPRDEAPRESDERIGRIHSPLGAVLRETGACVAGDLCAVPRLEAAVGDVLSDPAHPVHLAARSRPEPLLPIAVAARDRADEDAVARGLARLVATDPGLRLERDPETHQTVLWCAGEAHADVALGRLRDSGVEVDLEEVRVPLRVTPAGPGRATGRHVKQSGGHGQYAVCHVEFTPGEPGSGLEFSSAVVGGAVPTQYVPSVEKGIRAQLERGLPAAEGEPLHPVVDVVARLVDGKAHSVDSSDAAFQTAGALAVRAAAQVCGLRLLEPVDEVRIRVRDEHLGAVLGDLSARRGKVLATEPDGAGHTDVRAEVPRAELLRHAVDLRSLTAGTGFAARSFARWSERPR